MSLKKTNSGSYIPAFQNIKLATAAFSTRVGGVSQHPYNTLNLAYHVRDVPDAVAENRRRFCGILGVDVGSLVIAQQVHGNKIAVVDESHAGRGAYRHEDALEGMDGMVTRSASVTLAVLTADCVPVLVVDPINRAVGIAHAGWRGALLMIATKIVMKMREVFGTEARNCVAALGPSISLCCYTVGEEVISQFQNTFGLKAGIVKDRLDLQQAVKAQLIDAGVNSIFVEEACTACNRDLFFSHRAEGGRTGRMMSVVRLVYD